MHNEVYVTPQERRRQKALERRLPALRPTPTPAAPTQPDWQPDPDPEPTL